MAAARRQRRFFEVIHQTERVTLYLGDALTILPTLRTESMELVLTDPPYGVEWQSNFRTAAFDAIQNDTPADRAGVHQVLADCVRLTGQNRHIYVFGPEDVLAGLKVSELTRLIWDKGRTGMGDLSAPWGPAHEPISFVVSQHRHAGDTGKPKLAVRLRKGSVLRFPPPTGRKVRHPSEKPVPLLRELIESSTRADETVLDPYAGSGATGVAALLTGRRAVLVEIDPSYAALAKSRLQQAEALYLQGLAV